MDFLDPRPGHTTAVPLQSVLMGKSMGTYKPCWELAALSHSNHTGAAEAEELQLGFSAWCMKSKLYTDLFLLMCMCVYLGEPMPHVCSVKPRPRDHRFPGAGVTGV